MGLAASSVELGSQPTSVVSPDLVDTHEQGSCRAEHLQSLTVSFNGGGGWDLCWSIELEAGLRVSKARYTTPQGRTFAILNEASLAQIDVPYDDGKHEQLDLPGFGLLTSQLRPVDCPGGQRLSAPEHPESLCAIVQQDPLRYAWSDYDFGSGNHAAPGKCLLIYTITPASWYTYATKWRLCDDGSIVPSVDAGGTLSPHYFGDEKNGQPVGPGQSTFAMSHFHNIFWRLQFDLGGHYMSQIDDHVDGRRHEIMEEVVSLETVRDRADNRFWRSVSTTLRNDDHHVVSYDLRLLGDGKYKSSEMGRTYTNHDLYITEDSPCERLASENLHPPCATTVSDYVDGQHLTRPIVWVQISHHHIPRDEDQPIMNQHSQGFVISPRNLTASNELVRK